MNDGRAAPGKASGSFAGLTLDAPRLMGVINATPDSFSDGGEALDPARAIARGREMIAAGAHILDVGGESTRPGAAPVTAVEEMDRVLPVIEGLVAEGALVSIDSRRAAVMTAALAAGARIVNDVTALGGDPESLGVVAGSGAAVVLMHMRGEPGTMQDDPRYDDAPRDVFRYLSERAAACEAAGIERGRIAVDPGIGFGKTVAHNLQILNNLDLYAGLGCPVLIGVSRKSFIGRIAGEDAPKARLPGSLACVLNAHAQGVRLFRVHDVAETRQALAVWDAIAGAGAGAGEKN